MLDLTVSEELILPVPIERARETLRARDHATGLEHPGTISDHTAGPGERDSWLRLAGNENTTAPPICRCYSSNPTTAAGAVECHAELREDLDQAFHSAPSKQTQENPGAAVGRNPRCTLAIYAAAAPRCAAACATSTPCVTGQTRGPHLHLDPGGGTVPM